MKYIILVIAFVASIMLMATNEASAAAQWRCLSGWEGLCYIKRVEFGHVSNAYVKAKMHEDGLDTDDDCLWITYESSDVERVRGVEALMLTALTTGTLVAYKVSSSTEHNECDIVDILLSQR
jgi:hypothetical protein